MSDPTPEPTPAKLDPANTRAPLRAPAPAADPPAPFVPAVPTKLPQTGDRVRFVLKPLGPIRPKIRAATVTEAWDLGEKHPAEAWKARPVGAQPTVTGDDGKPILGDDGKPCVPVGLVNLEVHLDCHGRKDLNEGHDRFVGHVLYDPKKASGTWHWPGD